MGNKKKPMAITKLHLGRVRDRMAEMVKETLSVRLIGSLESAISEYRILLETYREECDASLVTLDDPEKQLSLLKEMDTYCQILYLYEGEVKLFHSLISSNINRQSLIPNLNTSVQESVTPTCSPKLPKIEIPKFNGDILNFSNFRALFENMVHTKVDLSNVTKLYHLKNALIDDAKELLRDFELTNDAYPEAWSYLLNRFDNPRAVGRALFRKLKNLASISSKNEVTNLLDQVDVILRGIRSNGGMIDTTFSQYIAFHVTCCLDKRTREDFEYSSTSKQLPRYEDLRIFLQNRSFASDDTVDNNKRFEMKLDNKFIKPRESKFSPKEKFIANFSKSKCILCKGDHFIDQCALFLKKNSYDRFLVIKDNKLCTKCLRPNHRSTACTRPACQKCNGLHHTLLHREQPKTIDEAADKKDNVKESEKSDTLIKSTCSAVSGRRKNVFLQTAVVKVHVFNQIVLGRILMDPGSEESLVTRSFVKRHGLRTYAAEEAVDLIGVNEGSSIIDQRVDIVIQSRFNNFKIAISCGVIKSLPYLLDKRALYDVMSRFKGINLGESNEYPINSVDILVGSEFCEFIMEERRQFYEGLVLRDSKFGWLLSGSQKTSFLTSKAYCSLSIIDVNTQLRKFWELENVENVSASESSSEYKTIEKHFESTVSRDTNGKFIVRLPFKPSINSLNGSYGVALRIFKNIERRQNVELSKAYSEFMSEYEILGHMSKLSVSEPIIGYYIPHHMVQKTSSTTTKFRVVFNASKKDYSNTSLNDHLMVGPVLQPELFDILIKFRVHRVAFCADIEKMYRQVWVHPTDRKYQRILWRNDKNTEVCQYQLNTVTYGTASASYLVTKCLQVASRSIEKENPIAANVICKDFYMDDLMTGSEDVQSALILQKTIRDCLGAHGFPLRKFQCNCDEFLNALDPSIVEKLEDRLLGAEFIHILGLKWCPCEDVLKIVLRSNPLPQKITKRIVLSEIARVFDVLGFLSPFTIRAKIFLQDLWKEDLNWDDVVSEELCSNFLQYCAELLELQDYNIPRCYFLDGKISKMELVGFCDASTKAYCATVYLRSTDIYGNSRSILIAAKSRVAPLKALTIPRLELMAACILSTLVKRISTILNISNCYFFSDSTIVLAWLRHPLEQLKQYVSNRVKIILDNVSVENWFYVPSNDNPADLATRGISAKALIESFLWKFGPTWMDSRFFNYCKYKFDNDNIPEQRKIKSKSFNMTTTDVLFYKFSDYNRLINVTSYILRFYNNCRRQIIPLNVDLSIEERNTALNYLIRISQKLSFPTDINRLINGKLPKKSSCLRALNPFLDDNGIVRVNGRLSNNLTLDYNIRFPIILSSKCKYSYLYITFIHEKYFHCSRDVIRTFLGNRYWFVYGDNNLIKKIINKCVLCRRLKANTGTQLMGQLPKERVSISRPFTHVGVDFAGHFNVKCINHRTTKYNKAYAAFFVCFCTRAVHIEIVSDLSTALFIQSLKRFCARRGKPRSIFSDNGKNFLGASNALYSNRNDIVKWSSQEGIYWKFISPRSPHQGGLWESSIKSGKSLMRRAIGNHILNFEELTTVFSEVEAVLNSRPLSHDGNGKLITPAHFLIGDHLLAVPMKDDVQGLPLKRRLMVTSQIIKSFWSTWYKDYLHTLQKRCKWTETRNNIKVNDIVLLKEDDTQPLTWPMGRVIQVFPDKCGIVRNVAVQTSSGTLQRSIQKLVILLPDEAP